MLKPLIELLVAAIFWGFGFIAAIWSLEKMSPGALVFYRFMGAFLVGSFILFLMGKKFPQFLIELRLAIVPGLFMAATLVIQNLGLKLTTATNSAFITSLYVVWVPLLAAVIIKSKVKKSQWLFVALALLGTALMIKTDFVFKDAGPLFAPGDLITLICSLFAAGHILTIDKVAVKSKDHFAFNVAQCAVSGVAALTLFPLESNWSLHFTGFKPWFGLFALALGSSLIAFWLQIRAQKKLNPTVASILFLLESPFSAFFAFWLLQESMNLQQFTGAGLIMLAGILSIVFSESKVENSQL